jgi:hypothetical protein
MLGGIRDAYRLERAGTDVQGKKRGFHAAKAQFRKQRRVEV